MGYLSMGNQPFELAKITQTKCLSAAEQRKKRTNLDMMLQRETQLFLSHYLPLDAEWCMLWTEDLSHPKNHIEAPTPM